ncbi:MAG TPA: hypothetical protein VJX67_27040 [Blastocatellia bacterium]|nr:hypothetical protein [Blastocatellia bacterium]
MLRNSAAIRGISAFFTRHAYAVCFFGFVAISLSAYSYHLRFNGWTCNMDEVIHLQDGIRIATSEWSGPPSQYFADKSILTHDRMRGVFSYIDWGRYAPSYFISHAIFYILLGPNAVQWYRLQFLMYLAMYFLAFHLGRRLRLSPVILMVSCLVTFVNSAASEVITRIEKPEGRMIPYLFLSTYLYLWALTETGRRRRIGLLIVSAPLVILGGGAKEIGIVIVCVMLAAEFAYVLMDRQKANGKPGWLPISYILILLTVIGSIIGSFCWAQRHFLGHITVRILGRQDGLRGVFSQTAVLRKYYDTAPDALLCLAVLFAFVVAVLAALRKRRIEVDGILLHAIVLIGLPVCLTSVFYLLVYPDGESYYLSYCVIGAGLCLPLIAKLIDWRLVYCLIVPLAIVCMTFSYPFAAFDSTARGLQNYVYLRSAEALHQQIQREELPGRPTVEIQFFEAELYELYWRNLYPHETPPVFTNRFGPRMAFENGEYRLAGEPDLGLQISIPFLRADGHPIDGLDVGRLYFALQYSGPYAAPPYPLLDSYEQQAEARLPDRLFSTMQRVICDYTYRIYKGATHRPLRRVPLDISAFRTCCGKTSLMPNRVTVENLGAKSTSAALEYYVGEKELEDWYRRTPRPAVIFCARGRGRLPGRGELVIVINGDQVIRSNPVDGRAAFETLVAGAVLPADFSRVRTLRLSFESIGFDPDLAEFTDWALYVH